VIITSGMSRMYKYIHPAAPFFLYPFRTFISYPLFFKILSNSFHVHAVHLDTIKEFFYLPTDAQLNCLKNNFKIYIKIDIKTAVLMSILM
jgi:hypothetical protein